MNLKSNPHMALFVFWLLFSTLNAQPAFRLGELPANDPAFNPAPLILTADDVADPPPGEIRKQYVNHDVSNIRRDLAANLAAAPAGVEGQQSPWITKCQAVQAGLDQIITSRLQRDVFNLIPKLKEIFAASGTPGDSNFFETQRVLLRKLAATIINAMAEYIADQNASVPASDLTNFISIFSQSGFVVWEDWVDLLLPVDSPGIMILDPSAVSAQLKALPWKYADNFLHGYSTSEAFEDYAPSGGGLPALKTKFSSNHSLCIEKWNELTDWVAQQKVSNP